MRTVILVAAFALGALLSPSGATSAKAKTSAKARAKAKAKQPFLSGQQGVAVGGELRDVFAELQSVAQLTGKVANTMGTLMQQGAFQQQQQQPQQQFQQQAPQAPPAPTLYATPQNLVDPTVGGAASLIGTPLIEDLPPQDMSGKYQLPASAQPLTNPPTTTTTTAAPTEVPPELAFLLPPVQVQAAPPVETPQQIQAQEQANAESVARQLAALVPVAQTQLERDSRRFPQPAPLQVQPKINRQHQEESGLWRTPSSPKPQATLISGAQVAGLLSNASISALFKHRRAPTWTMLSRHINTDGMFSMYKQKMAELKANRDGDYEQSRKYDKAEDDDDDSDDDDAPSPAPRHMMLQSEDGSLPAPPVRQIDLPPADPQAALEQLITKTEGGSMPDYSAEISHPGQVALPQVSHTASASNDQDDKDDDDTPEQRENLLELEKPQAPAVTIEAAHPSLIQTPPHNAVTDELAILEGKSSLWKPGAYPRPAEQPIPARNVYGDYQRRLALMSEKDGAPPPTFHEQSPIFQTYQRRMQQEVLKQRAEDDAPRPTSDESRSVDMMNVEEARPQPQAYQQVASLFDGGIATRREPSYEQQGVASLFDGGIAAHRQQPGVPPTRQFGMATNALRRNLFAPNLFDSYRRNIQKRMLSQPPAAASSSYASPPLAPMPSFDRSRVASLWRPQPQVEYAQPTSLRDADAALSTPPSSFPSGQAGGIDFSGNNHQDSGLNFGLTGSGLFSRPSPVQQNSPLRKSVYDLYMQRLGPNNVAPRQSASSAGGGGLNVMADYRRRLAALQQRRPQTSNSAAFLQQPPRAPKLQAPQAHLLAELSGA